MNFETALPLLDGKYVPAETIDPAKHRYLGMFRPPTNPLMPAKPVYAVICYCGYHLTFRAQSREHYLQGCCDVPQYASITCEVESK